MEARQLSETIGGLENNNTPLPLSIVKSSASLPLMLYVAVAEESSSVDVIVVTIGIFSLTVILALLPPPFDVIIEGPQATINPKRPKLNDFLSRIENKNWTKIWPALTIVR